MCIYVQRLNLCSYRTYEEWKQLKHGTSRIKAVSVLTVPMRNGNVYRTSLPFSSVLVLTVPMRNGNDSAPVPFVPPNAVLTVPMRNGNVWHKRPGGQSITVLTVPMRNGNLALRLL